MNPKVTLGQLEKNLDTLVVMKVILAAIIMCVAESSLLVLILSLVLIGLSLLLRLQDFALPRWLVNITCIMMVFILAVNILKDKGDQLEVLIAMGHFTLGLQVVQLYSRMTLREYNLVMTLGLLQVVAANIINVSLGIGILTLIYAGLGLLCLLAYQMKRNRDAVDDANRGYMLDKKKIRALAVDFGKTNISIWNRIMMVSGYRSALRAIIFCCFVVSVFIFIVMPRSGRYTQTQAFALAASSVNNASGQNSTIGFNNQVNLRKPSPINDQDTSVTLSVKIREDGETLDRTDVKLLRGTALDSYGTSSGSWQASDIRTNRMSPIFRDVEQGVRLEPIWPGEQTLDVEVKIRNARTRTLFSLGAPLYFQSEVIPALQYSRIDQTIKTPKRLPGPLSYQLKIRDYRAGIPNVTNLSEFYAKNWPNDQQENFLRFRQLAIQILDDANLLEISDSEYDTLQKVKVLDVESLIADLDSEAVATEISNHLIKPPYKYSLDNPAPDEGEDPVAQFLFDWREGHCELYASAHAALCRSVGMRARVIAGFRLSEYNQLTNYFVVRPGHAHSWTEVLCDDKWETFDPTPSSAVNQAHESVKPRLMWLSHMLDMINASWVQNVMAFDAASRAELLSYLGLDAESREKYLILFKQLLQKLVLMVDERKFEAMVYLGLMIVMMIWCASSLILLWRSRRRIKLLNLNDLGRVRRRQLRKDLAFYFHFLDLIRKYGFKRKPWQSHRQFLDGLLEDHVVFARDEIRQKLLEMNEAFYRIRFGGWRPTSEDARKYIEHVRVLKRALRSS